MSNQTELVVIDTVQALLMSVWIQVGKDKVKNKYALTTAKEESIDFLTSHISNENGNKEKQSKIFGQTEPKSIGIDSFANGVIQKSQEKIKSNNLSIAFSVSQNNASRFRKMSKDSHHKRTISIKSVQKEDKKNLITLLDLPSPHEIKDERQESVRKKKFQSERESKRLKEMIEAVEKDRKQNSERNIKMMKNLKKYTYNYDGSLCQLKGTDKGGSVVFKIDNKSGREEIKRKAIKNPQQRVIQNEKIKARDISNSKKIFNDLSQIYAEKRTQSLFDLFEFGKIQEGVKLTEDKGQNKIIKENPRKRLQKQFQRGQFKSNRQKPYTSVDNKQMRSKRTSTISHDVEQNHFQASTLFKMHNTSSLPPIKKHYPRRLKCKAIDNTCGGYSKSQKSILNSSMVSEQKLEISRIKIDHQELYCCNFVTDNR